VKIAVAIVFAGVLEEKGVHISDLISSLVVSLLDFQ
jgi:hypothetical protein